MIITQHRYVLIIQQNETPNKIQKVKKRNTIRAACLYIQPLYAFLGNSPPILSSLKKLIN